MDFSKIQKLGELSQKTNAVNSGSIESTKSDFVNSAFASAKTDTSNGSNNQVIQAGDVAFIPGNDADALLASALNGNSASMSNFLSSYQSQLNSMMTQAKIQTGVTTLGTFAGILGNVLSGTSSVSDKLGGIFGSDKTQTTKLSDQESAQKTANSAIKDLGLTNDLADAIKSFSKKGNDKHKAELQKQLSAAEADRSTLAAKVAEQDTIISEATTSQKALEDESKQLNEQATKMQGEIDKLTDSIKNTAQGKIDKLDEDDKKQNETITNSKKAVEQKKQETTNAIAEQNNKISEATPKLQAMKTETYIDARGNVQTRQVPDNETRAQAKKDIEDAKAEIKRLEQERDDFIKAEEEKQKEATDKIAQNAIDRSEQQAIIADPKSDPENGAALTEKITERGKVVESKSEKDTAIQEQKTKISNATTLRNTCQSKMTELSGQMAQARQLLGS